GSLAGVLLGLGEERPPHPSDRPELALGRLASVLPSARYHLEDRVADPCLAAVAWALNAYRFRRFKAAPERAPAHLILPGGADEALTIVDAIWLGRDLINRPASDLGPRELEDAARDLAQRHGAEVASVVGDELLNANFPLLHAVGRASERPPRLIDLTWGR